MDSEKINKIFSDKRFWFCLLVIVTAVSRIITISGNYAVFSWDTGNFALAVDSFSLQEGSPHLPGYFLHVQFIDLLTSITGNKFVSMNLFSVFYSAMAAGFIFLIFTRWLTIFESVLIALLVITNPLVWYFGSVAEIYSFDLFTSALLVWMGLSPYAVVVTPSLMALISGVRPSTGILLMPLYIYFWQMHFRNKSVSLKTTLFYHAAAVIILLSWLAPLLIISGGIDAYIQVYRTNNPVENITILQSLYRFTSYLITLLPIVFIFFIVAFINRNRERNLVDTLREYVLNRDFYFLHWWLWPSLIFFVFVHYSKGYILINIIPVLALGFFILKNQKLRKIITAAIVFIQIMYFCFFPYNNPNPEIYFSSVKRQIDLFETWHERTTSEYLMGRSHIVALQNCHDFISDAVESVVLNAGDKKYLFFDPMVIVSPRAMQAHLPQMEITKFLSSSGDQYGYHNRRIQEARSGLIPMLSEALIISRLDFIEEYLSDLKIDYYKRDKNWGIFFVSEDEAPKLAAIYKQLFSR